MAALPHEATFPNLPLAQLGAAMRDHVWVNDTGVGTDLGNLPKDQAACPGFSLSSFLTAGNGDDRTGAIFEAN